MLKRCTIVTTGRGFESHSNRSDKYEGIGRQVQNIFLYFTNHNHLYQTSKSVHRKFGHTDSVSVSFKHCLHLPHRSAFSTVDCFNAEIENFLSLSRNRTVHCRVRTSVNESSSIVYTRLQICFNLC